LFKDKYKKREERKGGHFAAEERKEKILRWQRCYLCCDVIAIMTINVKKVFLRFFKFLPRLFKFFDVFFILLSVFYFKKRALKIPLKVL